MLLVVPSERRPAEPVMSSTYMLGNLVSICLSCLAEHDGLVPMKVAANPDKYDDACGLWRSSPLFSAVSAGWSRSWVGPPPEKRRNQPRNYLRDISPLKEEMAHGEAHDAQCIDDVYLVRNQEHGEERGVRPLGRLLSLQQVLQLHLLLDPPSLGYLLVRSHRISGLLFEVS